MDRDKLIPKHGGYRKLKSFQLAQLIFDITVRFCERYIDKRSRTHDQMAQAARSGPLWLRYVARCASLKRLYTAIGVHGLAPEATL
jgi:hypothetical protein